MCTLSRQFEELEQRTLACLRNVNPHTGTVHDYRNILRPLDRAQDALHRAYVAMDKASAQLSEIASEQ